jgi:hypothetical protein
MLASALISIKVAPELAEMGKLCPQQDVIITKFNQLLARLHSNSAARNASDLAAFAREEKAIQDWLNIESEYRLASGKAAKSKEGAAYAQGQYEKWNALLTASKARQEQETKDDVPKQTDIDSERALIKELLGLIGTLQNSEVTKANSQAILQQFNQKVIFAPCLLKTFACKNCLACTQTRKLRNTPFCSFSSSNRRPRTEVVSGWLRQVSEC